ncbi:hypothetical protein PHISP_01531 [Aspergillus sp. HF37]|nr:hypothetical protein PHISP_01531 [Aspergillus sp. HF37]
MTDKQPAKPFTPTLSAAFNRSSKSASPLTPKLAKPGVPTPKRFTPSDPRSSSPPKDDPAASLLSANVTPRSGPRNSRRDGAVSSPTNTPTSTHHSPQSLYSSPVVTPGSNYAHRTDRSPGAGSGRPDPRTARAKTLASENIPRANSYDPHSSPRFFHASDARSPPADPEPKPKQAKLPASFFYADGRQGEKASEDTNSPVPGVQRRSQGIPPRPITVAKPSSATVPRLRSPNHNDSARWSDTPRSQNASHPGSPDDGSRLHTSPLSKSNEGPLPVSGVHIKSASIDSGRHSTPPREGLRPSPIIISPSDSQAENTPDPDPILLPRPRILSNGSTASADTQGSAQSPGKSEGASPTKSDPAANARVERKILDLEISNSSLLAINRTLEREMRKQHAELRRYRRLSRSGHLSMAASARSVSGGGLSATSEAEEGTSELSSIHLPDDMSACSEESVDESAMSPDSLAEHDARHQARDEKRFYVDLAQHQELLVGSQKMDHSIRRCLGWTEELINEGQKALDYAVHVSDVELGGRVLAPEELTEVGESARGLLSPTHDAADPEETDSAEPT